eukprot:scaffold250378_cov28-Tisochrysis_lutea.AAC.1
MISHTEQYRIGATLPYFHCIQHSALCSHCCAFTEISIQPCAFTAVLSLNSAFSPVLHCCAFTAFSNQPVLSLLCFHSI